jgi:hypothetical protein
MSEQRVVSEHTRLDEHGWFVQATLYNRVTFLIIESKFKGVFMLVAGGVIVGIFLIFVEIAYKKRKDKKLKEYDLSRKAFANWRKNVEV